MDKKDDRTLFEIMRAKRYIKKEDRVVINLRLGETQIKQLENRETILIYIRGLPFDLKRSG